MRASGAARTWKTQHCRRRLSSSGCRTHMRRYCPARATTSSNEHPRIVCTSARRSGIVSAASSWPAMQRMLPIQLAVFGLTSGLFDSFALYPALTAIVLEGADEEVLDRYSTA